MKPVFTAWLSKNIDGANDDIVLPSLNHKRLLEMYSLTGPSYRIMMARFDRNSGFVLKLKECPMSYAGKILRVDLTTGTIDQETLPMDLARKFND